MESRSASFEGSKGKEAQMKKGQSKPPSEEYANFEKLAKQLISVPESEIEKREAEYQRAKKTHRKKKRVA